MCIYFKVSHKPIDHVYFVLKTTDPFHTDFFSTFLCLAKYTPRQVAQHRRQDKARQDSEMMAHHHVYYEHTKIINLLRPRRKRRHFEDNIFKCIFLNENLWTSLMRSLKFVPNVQINNIPALVQIMAWRRPGAKPLSEPMMINLLTQICASRPQWVNGIIIASI